MHSPLDFTAHAKTMMQERMIQEDWVKSTVHAPDMIEEKRERKTLPEADPAKCGKVPAGNRQPLCPSLTGDHGVL
jgi:hypothetical protein